MAIAPYQPGWFDGEMSCDGTSAAIDRGKSCREEDVPVPGTIVSNGVTQVVVPGDPNEKVGPPGTGPLRVVRVENDLRYTIHFENVITATAPAQEVFVTDKLDPSLDWSTFRVDEIMLGNHVIPVADDAAQFSAREPINDHRAGVTKSWWVDITAQLNPATGRVGWALRTLDPDTGELPEDPLAGFLPPNDTSGRGQGYVSFTIRPKAGVPIGTVIRNRASIVFDTNDPISTNEVWNTVDQPKLQTYLPLIRR